MALLYKLEYINGIGDEGVYIQMRSNPTGYQTLISKEDYVNGKSGAVASAFMNALFAVAGVVRASSQAHRVYVEKSPAFNWTEVLNALLPVISTQVGQGGTYTKLNGPDITLENQSDRRPLQ